MNITHDFVLGFFPAQHVNSAHQQQTQMIKLVSYIKINIFIIKRSESIRLHPKR